MAQRTFAGRPGPTFDVKVTKIEEPGEVTVDDEFAKKLGQDSLEKLQDAIKQRFVTQKYRQATRLKLKRALLDVLAESHSFEVPPGMVDMEFEAIWRQLTAEMQRLGQSFADEDKSEEEAKEEYRKIAERRVRLGLLLSDIGTKNEVKVENKELQQAMIAQAQTFSRPSPSGIRVLPEEPVGARTAARPDLRG